MTGELLCSGNVHSRVEETEPPQDFPSVRSVMARARIAVMPLIPPTIEDVRIEGPWAETWGRDQFLLHQEEDWAVAVLATKDNLRKLRCCGTVYMAGTFFIIILFPID